MKATAPATADPYELREEDVEEPPRSLAAALRRIGPGIPAEMAPSPFVTLGLWSASLIMLVATAYGVVQGLK